MCQKDSLAMTVLLENTNTGRLCAEHGLSIWIDYTREGTNTRVLLDFGQSDAFAQNAAALGIDLGSTDVAVLSHAHYDHADGMPTFCTANDHARIYLSDACRENCWSTKGGTSSAHYIGVARGLLEGHTHRLSRVPTDRMTTIASGIHLVPHSTPDLARVGERTGMLLLTDEGLVPDNFLHEMSLVFELTPSTDGTPRIAVFNSCSHAGIAAISNEVAQAFPGASIAAYVGGLHLVHATDNEVQQVADIIQHTGIEHLYTGHCTGESAMSMLKRALPGRVYSLHPGLTAQVA